MKKRDFVFWIILVAVVVGFVSGLVTWNLAVSAAVGPSSFILTKEQYKLFEEFRKISEIKTVIDKYFYQAQTDESRLRDGAFKGYVEGLQDPYSYYMDEDSLKAMRDFNSGEFSGIGISVVMNTEKNLPMITNVYKGSPSEKAGLTVGDIITAVDGNSISGLTLDLVVAKMKGVEGTKVNVKIERDGKELDFDIIRQKIELDVIESKLMDNNIGYVRLFEFSGKSGEKCVTAFEDLKKQGVKGFIFDLRDNGGGLVDEAAVIADYLLPKGIIVETVTKDVVDHQWKSDANYLNMPMIVLQNKNSASASEIVAGALRDYEAATLVGTQTYGKSAVQQTYTLSDGTSAVRVTTSKYRLPKGEYTPHEGLPADVEVQLPEDVLDAKVPLTESNDTQLQKGQEVLLSKIK